MVTLSDINKAFNLDPDNIKQVTANYGKVVSINPDKTYQVSLNGSDTTVKCARLTGAKVGDVVLVTTLKNGYSVVTGCVGGDTDAADAQATADSTAQYFWTDTDGAHVTEDTREDYEADPSNAGNNLLLTATGIFLRKALQKFAEFLTTGLTVYNGSGATIAHLGYGPGKNSSGGTSDAPYYDIGYRNTANDIGNYSTAEGYNNSAENYCSHAEGRDNGAEGYCAHAEGYNGNADGYAAHSEGDSCHAYGGRSHAEGYHTTADASYTHAEGYNTYAAYNYQHVCGKYNDYNSQALFQVGNGTSTSNRKNAFEIYESGAIRAGTETVSIASGDFTTTTGSISSVSMYRFGNVIQLVMQVTKSSATDAGSNVYSGVLKLADYRPKAQIECGSYSGSVAVIGSLETDGTITARVTGAQLPAGRSPVLTFTYLI